MAVPGGSIVGVDLLAQEVVGLRDAGHALRLSKDLPTTEIVRLPTSSKPSNDRSRDEKGAPTAPLTGIRAESRRARSGKDAVALAFSSRSGSAGW
jgi:hypothetical protein